VPSSLDNLFDDEPAPEPKPPATPAAPAPPAGAKPPPPPAPPGDRDWPASILSLAEASGFLRGEREVTPALAPALERFLKTVSEAGQSLLAGELVEFDAAPFFGAVASRFRIAVALEQRPASSQHVDTESLEQLLAQADRAIAALRAAEDAGDGGHKVFEAERGALVKAAVVLSENGYESSRDAAATTAEALNKKYEPMQARVAAQTGHGTTERGPWLRRALYAVGALAVGAAALAVFLQLNGPRYRPAVTLSRGVVATGEAGPNSVEIFHSEDGLPLDEVAVWQLKARAEASGRKLRRAGPGEWVIVPSGWEDAH
jgi:hypothetical protein